MGDVSDHGLHAFDDNLDSVDLGLDHIDVSAGGQNFVGHVVAILLETLELRDEDVELILGGQNISEALIDLHLHTPVIGLTVGLGGLQHLVEGPFEHFEVRRDLADGHLDLLVLEPPLHYEFLQNDDELVYPSILYPYSDALDIGLKLTNAPLQIFLDKLVLLEQGDGDLNLFLERSDGADNLHGRELVQRS